MYTYVLLYCTYVCINVQYIHTYSTYSTNSMYCTNRVYCTPIRLVLGLMYGLLCTADAGPCTDVEAERVAAAGIRLLGSRACRLPFPCPCLFFP